MSSPKMLFVGAGRMASAIIEGLIKKKHLLPSQIICTCGNDSTGLELSKKTGIRYMEKIDHTLVKDVDTVILACKPQQIDQVDPELKLSSEGKLVLSVLAGVSLKKLHQTLPGSKNVIRTMPNTPGSIGEGVTAYTPKEPLTAEHAQTVSEILSSLGVYHEVEEQELDAVTGVSGSGPAYVFQFAAALRDGGIKSGLSSELAMSLAIDTLRGSAELLSKDGNTPESLTQGVCSPGGTTQAALNVLEDSHFTDTVSNAVTAACERSIELREDAEKSNDKTKERFKTLSPNLFEDIPNSSSDKVLTSIKARLPPKFQQVIGN